MIIESTQFSVYSYKLLVCIIRRQEKGGSFMEKYEKPVMEVEELDEENIVFGADTLIM